MKADNKVVVKPDEDSDIGASMKAMVEAYLNTLPNCVNRELIDKVSTDLYQHNSLHLCNGHCLMMQRII